MNLYPNETMVIEGDGWCEMRLKNIGGSEIAGLFDVQQPYQLSRYGLWMVKSGKAKDEFDGNERTIWGNRLESAIAEGIAEDEGWSVRKGGYFEDVEVKGMGSTLDYIIESDPERDGPGAFEIKNVDGIVFSQKWLDDEPPLHILLQLQHQLACSGFKWGAIGALIGGNTIKVYRYEARKALIADIRKRVKEFWQSIDDNVKPYVDGDDNTAKILKAINTPVSRDVLDVGDDALWKMAVDEYLETSKNVKKATAKHDLAKNRLIERLGTHKEVKGVGFKVSQSVTAMKPDRVAKPGEIISGRAETRRYYVKEK